jgi:twitching motility protein PilT
VKNLARFRANVFMQKGASGGVFRTIPFKIRSFSDLGLPPVLEDLCNKPRGLVLITGPTGSGKVDHLAAMIDKINSERHEHIVTMEDPIDVHPPAQELRGEPTGELGSDTKSFKEGSPFGAAQDPDVVLVGEMRDLETIEAALTNRRRPATSASERCTPTRPCRHQPGHRCLPAAPASHRFGQQLSFVLEGVVLSVADARAPPARGVVAALEVMYPQLRHPAT